MEVDNITLTHQVRSKALAHVRKALKLLNRRDAATQAYLLIEKGAACLETLVKNS